MDTCWPCSVRHCSERKEFSKRESSHPGWTEVGRSSSLMHSRPRYASPSPSPNASLRAALARSNK